MSSRRQHWIAGRPAEPESSVYLSTVNPATGEPGDEVANDTEYGLVAAVWTADIARGIRMAEQIQAGQVAINGGALSIETPFGGFKNSGYGREKGMEALDDYTQTQTVSVALR